MKNERIFAAVQPLEQFLTEKKAWREEQIRKNPDMAGIYRDASDSYRHYYADALKRLDQHDILPMESAADLMGLTPEAYVRKADRGQAILIEIEGRSFVPRFTLNTRYKNARIKPFHLDIAQEFAEGPHQQFFKFMDYLGFMNQRLDIAGTVPERRLPEIFKAAGVSKGNAHVILSVPMTEIVDRALKNPHLMASLVNKLGSAVSEHGGMNSPNCYGLSDEFMARYVPADLPHRDRWKRDIPQAAR